MHERYPRNALFMPRILSPTDRLVQLAEEAQTVICIPMVERPFLEDWVHPDGPMIVVGEAAHPLTVRLSPMSLRRLATSDHTPYRPVR